MNILIPYNWLREFINTDASASQIQSSLSLCGPSVERLHQTDKDYVLDVEVTTNRVDCMSILGISREAAAILPQFGHSAKLISPKLASVDSKLPLGITIENDPQLCQRIICIKLEGVTITESPEWLQKRLEQVGQRSLNNVVDITNYVMWEMGHPIHAFDYDRLHNRKIIVRRGKKGESLTTLDDKTHHLLGGEVVFDDGKGEIIDLPGIMGTQNTVVTPKTRNVLLFLEISDHHQIRKTSMSLGIRTQAAVLNEKGIDPTTAYNTMLRAIHLYKEITGASIGSELLDIYPSPTNISPISLPKQLLDTYLGISVESSRVKDIFTSLGFQFKENKTSFSITPPYWRTNDILIPQDLIEEVARIYGYHNLPSQIMTGQIPTQRNDQIFNWEKRIKSILSGWGLTETYTYSLVSSDLVDTNQALQIKNPLSSEWEYLRTSLIPSHQKVVAENLGRTKELDLFEIANVYLPQGKNDLPDEKLHLVITTTRNISYLKGIATALFTHHFGVTISFKEGIDWKQSQDSHCISFEIDLTKVLPSAKTSKTYTPISKYSPIIEDINFVCPKDRGYDKFITQIKAQSQLVKDIQFVDNYHDKMTLRITFNSDEKQLTSQSIAPLRQQIQSLSAS